MVASFVKKVLSDIILVIFHRKRAKIPTECRRIGLVMCHWLGDTFWASQTLPPLREHFADADIHVFLRKDFSALFYNLVATENIHIVPEVISDRKRENFSFFSLWKKAREYREPQFDLIIDITGNRYSAIFSRLLHPKYLIGFEGDEFGGLYDLRPNPQIYKNCFLWQRPLLICAKTLKCNISTASPQPPPLHMKYSDVYEKYNLLQPEQLVIIAPCAGWTDKEWGDEKFADLCKALKDENCRILITGTPAEYERCEKIAKANADATAWQGNLEDLFTLLSNCKCFIGNDSGLGHIAASFNSCRVISIFTGTTNPRELAPVGKYVTTVEENSKKTCFDEILNAVKQSLN
jgi:ADP-heptose:LPS heptosyltransferase